MAVKVVANGGGGAVGPAGAAGASGTGNHTVATTYTAGDATIELDRAPNPALARQGYLAIGVGLATCEIGQISGTPTETITLVNALFQDHDVDELVMIFYGDVSPDWWGAKGFDTTVDNLAAFEGMLRAVQKTTSLRRPGINGQGKDYYVSGPFVVSNQLPLNNFRLQAKTSGGGYTGPKDGPGPTRQGPSDGPNSPYLTNAMVMGAQEGHYFTVDGATDVFTTVNAAGAATAHGLSNLGRIVFDSSNTATGVTPGRMYRAVTKSSTTFKIVEDDDRVSWTVDTTTDVFTTTANHGYSDGNEIVFNVVSEVGGTIPGGISTQTTYFVRDSTATTFKVAATAGGAAIDITGSNVSGYLNSPVINAGNGAGFVWTGLLDNTKAYMRNVHLDGQNVGRFSFTAAAATDVFTTASAHGLSDGNVVVLDGTALPTGVTGGDDQTYYVRDSAATTFKLAATSGGSAIDLTADGSGNVRNKIARLNGFLFAIQQPSYIENCRVDKCPGFNLRILTQQGKITNFETIGGGVGVEIGDEGGSAGSFDWFEGLDIEQSELCAMRVRYGVNLAVRDFHYEFSPGSPKSIFDFQTGYQQIMFENVWATFNVQGISVFRFRSGSYGKKGYKITGFNGTGPSSDGVAIMIEDRDRGIYLDAWTHFRNKISEFEAFSPSDSDSFTDPMPRAFYGERGQYRRWGGTKPSVAYDVYRDGATRTGDMEQKFAWVQLTGTVSLDVPTSVFTMSSAHGLSEGQEISVSTTGTTTVESGTPAYVNHTVYFVRNPTATTFQISHTPVDALIDFATASTTTGWTFKKETSVLYRINAKALPIIRVYRNAAGTQVTPVAADFSADECAIYLDPTAASPKLHVAGKDSAGTFFDVALH